MYSTCLFCHRALGANDAIEPFPVGRRIAFDPARGRLWAVCSMCGGWNLAPVEERYEALEACERAFRGTRLRYSTDNIGLARLADGTELVRIGPALRPEVAAWRYGGRLRGARSTAVATVSSGAARIVGLAAQWLPTETASRALDAAARLRAGVARHGDRVLDVIRIPDEDVSPARVALNDHPVAIVRVRHLEQAVLARPEPGEPWRLEVAHDAGTLTLRGAAGLRASSKLLAATNRVGVTGEVIDAAARRVDDAADPAGYFGRVLALALRTQWGRVQTTETAPARVAAFAAENGGMPLVGRLALHLAGRSFWARGGIGCEPMTPLLRVPLADRLALEMAAHEDAERRALEGELEALQAAWKEAEEIAAIADAL